MKFVSEWVIVVRWEEGKSREKEQKGINWTVTEAHRVESELFRPENICGVRFVSLRGGKYTVKSDNVVFFLLERDKHEDSKKVLYQRVPDDKPVIFDKSEFNDKVPVSIKVLDSSNIGSKNYQE